MVENNTGIIADKGAINLSDTVYCGRSLSPVA
jgi:hypothetical protein